MDDQLESDVRAALARRAATLPVEAGERLLAVDYRQPAPVRRMAFLGGGTRPRIALGAAVAIVAAIALTATSLMTRTSPVFAGWTAAPTTADATAAASADATCRAQIVALPETPAAIPTDLTVALTDARGPFTWVLYKSADGRVSCLLGPDLVAITAQSANGASGSVSVGAAVVAGGGSAAGGTGPTGGAVTDSSGGATSGSVITGGPVGAGAGGTTSVTVSGGPDGAAATTLHLSTADGKAYTVADGSTGADVTAVTMVLADGSRVAATVASGLFAAWWPGSQDATSMEITSASGTTTQPLPAAPALGPNGVPGPCPSGAECMLNTVP